MQGKYYHACDGCLRQRSWCAFIQQEAYTLRLFLKKPTQVCVLSLLPDLRIQHGNDEETDFFHGVQENPQKCQR